MRLVLRSALAATLLLAGGGIVGSNSAWSNEALPHGLHLHHHNHGAVVDSGEVAVDGVDGAVDANGNPIAPVEGDAAGYPVAAYGAGYGGYYNGPSGTGPWGYLGYLGYQPANYLQDFRYYRAYSGQPGCRTCSAGDCQYRWYGRPDLFYNYYVPPTCGGVGAQLYLSPRPVPPHVGNTYITYQPLMPHEFLYHHHRTYHRYYNSGQGLTRTSVKWCR
jgi:hypothetical protein